MTFGKVSSFSIGGREIGADQPPLVIAEIGINHEGSFDKAVQMVRDAKRAGCECVKFQTHIIEDEMIPNEVVPGNAEESIWKIMERCVLSKGEERELKQLVESEGMIFLSTPFSRAAAVQLEELGVDAYKIGSGECNNYPLVEHIAKYGKPVILSTGMNDLESIQPAVDIFEKYGTPYSLLHCTSMYPTPYEKVRLGGVAELQRAFPNALVGLSDHSLGIYTSLAAIALGARIIEKHFVSDRSWSGPDVPISLTPDELGELVRGAKAVHEALGGGKTILAEEKPTIDFAYACVVTTKAISSGELFTEDNIWVKRPGTGEIFAKDYSSILGKKAARDIHKNTQLSYSDFE